MATDNADFKSTLKKAVAHLRQHRSKADRSLPQQTPEVARIQAAMDMHEFGVRLYRQRMHREHPHAGQGDVDRMVKDWLAEPSPGGQLRLPSRERGHGIR